jgi:hypothetical protein
MKTTYTATTTVYVTNKRGDVKVIKEGTTLNSKEWSKLPSDNARSKFLAAFAAKTERKPSVTRVYKRQILDRVERPADTLTDRAFAAKELGKIASNASYFFTQLLDLENALLKRVPAGELIFNGGNSSARRALQVVETNAAIYDDGVARTVNAQVIRLEEGFAVVQYGASAINLKDGRTLLA